MSSRRGGGKPSSFAGPSNASSKGKGIGPSNVHYSGNSGAGNTNAMVDQLSHDAGNLNLDSQGGDWEVFTKKTKNRAGGNAAKQWGNQSSTPNPWGSTPNHWGNPNVAPKLGTSGNSGTGKSAGGSWQSPTVDPKRTNGRGAVNLQQYNRSLENNYVAPPTVVPPPLQHGWQWASRAGSVPPNQGQGPDGGDSGSDTGGRQNQSDIDDDDDDLVEDDDDDDLMSDDFDSDDSVKSHETRKKNRWFKPFFEALDKLTIEQLNEPQRQWHCPACRNGPGAIDWYKGLQPLMAHAKTKGAKRVKLHRELAELLDEELNRRGTSVIPSGEVFGKWEGLRETVSDRQIVWPPMIVVMNTRLGMDENDQKWLGMGNQELLDYFGTYKAVKARHSYGPQGHRGMSLLIFENSAMGYLEAERLHKQFASQGTDRHAWETNQVLFYPGGKRQLYGYMARREDLDNFNRHCQGKTKLKFEMRSYHEMVVEPMKQMSEDNQQLVWLKNKVARGEKECQTWKESFGLVSQRLRKTMEENLIVRQRTKLQHEQNKEEMDYQEQFFKDRINDIHQALEQKERDFEAQLQDERKKVERSTTDSGTEEDAKLRCNELAEFIQSKGINEFEARRDELVKMHENKKAQMKLRHMEEEVELEKEFEGSLTKLMEQYAPR